MSWRAEQIEIWPVLKPVPYLKNAKAHPAKQVEELARSLMAVEDVTW